MGKAALPSPSPQPAAVQPALPQDSFQLTPSSVPQPSSNPCSSSSSHGKQSLLEWQCLKEVSQRSRAELTRQTSLEIKPSKVPQQVSNSWTANGPKSSSDSLTRAQGLTCNALSKPDSSHMERFKRRHGVAICYSDLQKTSSTADISWDNI